MNHRINIGPAFALVFVGTVVPWGTEAGRTHAQGPQTGQSVAVSEATLIEQIKRMDRPLETEGRAKEHLPEQFELKRVVVLTVDELLARYPKTSFRETALRIKLAALAALARVNPKYLKELRMLTDELSRSKVGGELAADADYYAIQAFVLAARLEGMPEETRVLGTMERYEAFLRGHRASRHIPVIWASLIRNALAANQPDRANREWQRMRRRFPNHIATRRAQGEIVRVTHIGKPFGYEFTTIDGAEIKTADFFGKVVLIHYWKSDDRESTQFMPMLVRLSKTYKDQGLELVGVNIDRDRAAFEAAIKTHGLTWPNYFDGKGRENDLLVGGGVTRTPAFYLLDRMGLLRHTEPGKRIEELIKSLLAEPRPVAQETNGG